MYTTTPDNIKIEWVYNPSPHVKITGPNDNEVFLLQVFEYHAGNTIPYLLESYLIANTEAFHYDVSYYGKFELRVLKFDEDLGPVEIFRDVYNDAGKRVKFILRTDLVEEERIFAEVVNDYIKQSGCIGEIVSTLEHTIRFPEVHLSNGHIVEQYADVDYNGEYYKIFYIGRNEFNGDNLYEHRWRNVSYGNWRLFWSFHNPRKYHNLESREIAEDILGFTENKPNGVKFTVTPSYL